jgi:peptide-methionine (S)-S-oxide reductase
MSLYLISLALLGWTSVGRSFPLSYQSIRKFNSHTIRLDAKQEATFGMGCFWKPSEDLLQTSGVLKTVVGYTGNTKATTPPSYDSVCFGREWVEAVRVYYDDDILSFRQLLDVFFEVQVPQLGSRQYSSIVFPHNEEQDHIAREWLSTDGDRRRSDGLPVKVTEIEPLTTFYQAEGYHQRYWAKQRPRFATIALLIMLSSGIVNSWIPSELESLVDTGANGLAIGIAVYVMLERVIDAKVVEL